MILFILYSFKTDYRNWVTIEPSSLIIKKEFNDNLYTYYLFITSFFLNSLLGNLPQNMTHFLIQFQKAAFQLCLFLELIALENPKYRVIHPPTGIFQKRPWLHF